PYVVPFIVLGTSFLPYWTLKKWSVGKTALASVIYFQGFWFVFLSFCIAGMLHWLPGFKMGSGVSILMILGGVQIAHFVIVLCLGTSASIARILTACIVWEGSTVLAFAGLQVVFLVMHSLLW